MAKAPPVAHQAARVGMFSQRIWVNPVVSEHLASWPLALERYEMCSSDSA